ncbi:Geranylgeranyl pyrophosphate synthase [Hirsutella minnesotensis 3608]|uniref:Geranylgeranyl pyrophosphate synthase n=1 Tax=Hirsutella minnesotensis 3608 TaxID=1043627 RepID=A0A0F7ZYT0_9HYPO|nr:Geranylgeranyl pyrophosphate synthase [Hirsutella minnesotensis 3608]
MATLSHSQWMNPSNQGVERDSLQYSIACGSRNAQPNRLSTTSKLGMRQHEIAFGYTTLLEADPLPLNTSTTASTLARPKASKEHLRNSHKLHRSGKQPLTDGQHMSLPQSLTIDTYANADLSCITIWSGDKENIIRAPFDYATSHQDIGLRTQLITSFNAWLRVPPQSLQTITKVIGMLHESSQLLDDVQDSSELRREFPVAQSIFGMAQTINSANYICYVALQELLKLNNQSAVSIFAEEVISLHRGQGMELSWRDTLKCPTEDEYVDMVDDKTSSLSRLAIRLMQSESIIAIDCVPLVNLIGRIYQIRGDLLNLSSQHTDNNGLCDDLTGGKFSFPIVHSIRSAPDKLQLINIIKQRTHDDEIKRYAVSFMERNGSLEYTRIVLVALIERARDLVTELDAGKGCSDEIFGVIAKLVV